MREILTHKIDLPERKETKIEGNVRVHALNDGHDVYQFTLRRHGQWETFARLQFQTPGAEPNGVTEEALMAALIDRFTHTASGHSTHMLVLIGAALRELKEARCK